MCFKVKPLGVNRLHGKSSNQGEYDPYVNILLGTLTAEHCSQSNNWTGEIDNIQSHQDRTKALIEMQLTAKPCHRHTTPIICKIDTGAEMNLISMQVFQKVVTDPRQRQLGPPQCKITAYGGDIVENPGSCQLYIPVHHKGHVRAVTFEVTKVLSPPMLGCKTCSDLGLVKFNCNRTQKLEGKEATNPPASNQSGDISYIPLTKEKLLTDLQDHFNRLGEFHMTPYHITLQPGAEPIVDPPRSIPVHLHCMRALWTRDWQDELGVISRVAHPQTGQTVPPYKSQLTIREKSQSRESS